MKRTKELVFYFVSVINELLTDMILFTGVLSYFNLVCLVKYL